MVSMYTIAGRQFASHHLAMAVLGSMAGGVAYSMGGSKVKKTQAPPINASSSDEEDFIKNFLKQADGGDKPADATKKEAAH